ncbi:unnamed protein product [Spirodela intermedia]|uniref:Uncharacterized protein n=1 Tax=Spirodela intermedia TaxID=51605 RepID=A0A7I8K4U4_SPIIN|nr:unnamed protein product [Spirodela intermedia]
MKWVVESSPAAVTRRSGKTATLRLSGGSSSSGPRSKRRLFIASGTLSGGGDSSLGGSSSSRRRLCTTTFYRMPNWPLMMWKGSDAHVSPISPSLAAQALAHDSAYLCFQPVCGLD